jgi:L,D-peptidoglycan transpeptidase YkuD (ErfK/YbiS/YcfS/YnhG family)
MRRSTSTSRRARAGSGFIATVVAVLLTVGLPSAVADVFSSPATGSHTVGGAILGKYRILGGSAGVLAYPTTDELVTAGGAGRYNHFQGGSIYWTSSTGAQQIGGAIKTAYRSLGWERSVLRFPTTDERSTPNRQGRYNHFQGGSIYWSPASGAWSIGGAIRDRWGQLGWENSALGFPITHEYAVTGGRAQDFQFGSIRWTPSGGAVVVGADRVGGGKLPLGVTPPGTQVVTVVASSSGATTAQVIAWERGVNGWSVALGPYNARIGAAGVGAASESSTRTPAGTFRLTEAFGRAVDPGTALPYRRVDGDDWWVSDVNSPRYNQYAQCAPGSCDFNERASENLAAAGPVYDLAAVIDYNRSGVRGAGSAFFLHVTNGGATAGCVAIERAGMTALLRWLKPASNPVISIGVG